MKCLAIVLLLVATVRSAQSTSDSEHDLALINQLKRTPVVQIDSHLPVLAFEKWLQHEAGEKAEFHWEVNDCGEQSGTPADRERDIPACVEVDVNMADKRSIVLFLAMPVNEKEAKPVLFFGAVDAPDESVTLHQLSDLPAALIKTHRNASPREIAPGVRKHWERGH